MQHEHSRLYWCVRACVYARVGVDLIRAFSARQAGEHVDGDESQPEHEQGPRDRREQVVCRHARARPGSSHDAVQTRVHRARARS
jgi:hypothetical protein